MSEDLKKDVNYGKPRPCLDEFETGLGRFTKISYNPDTNVYLYKREFDGLVYYEVFTPRRRKDCDYNIYPSTSQFGGDAKCCRNLEKAEYYLANGFTDK